MTLTNDISYTAQSFTETETITFTVDIIDPCETTTMLDAVFTPATLNVINGQTASITFPDATDTVETSKNIYTLCGLRTYELYENDEASTPTWVTLTYDGTTELYTIEASPETDDLVASHTFKLKTIMSDYSGMEHWTDVPISVSGAACD